MTNKSFEDHLSECQAGMISVALEYVDSRVDEVFVHAACEEGTSSFNVFYGVNGRVVRKEHVNAVINSGDARFDDSGERRGAMMDIGLDSIDSIEERCLEFGVEMPTEMRLHYDVRSGKFRAELRYDLVFTSIPDLLPGNVFDEWFSSEERAARGGHSA